MSTSLADVTAANVRAFRTRKRWRQQDLAEAIGLAQSSISAMEAGTKPIEVGHLVPLCQALEIGLDDLFRGAAPGDIRTLGRLPRVD